MIKFSSGFLVTIRLIYKNYGGINSLVRSEYFILSIIISAACWRFAWNGMWIDLSRSILPTLAGFSIAAYAIIFAVLDEKARAALREPAKELGGRSPLLVLVSAVSHAVIIQILAILYTIVYQAAPISVNNDVLFFRIMVHALSAIGLFLSVYGIVLVLGGILAIYRILEIQARIGGNGSG